MHLKNNQNGNKHRVPTGESGASWRDPRSFSCFKSENNQHGDMHKAQASGAKRENFVILELSTY